MRLTYPQTPEAGTIVAHIPRASPDVRQRFLAIRSDGELTTADGLTEVYPQSQAGNMHPPRSVVEHYIVRRTRTPYGYAKVWGHTPPCEGAYGSLNPIPRMEEEVSGAAVSMKRCADWWRERRPDPTEDRPVGRDYMKKIQKLYKEMSHD